MAALIFLLVTASARADAPDAAAIFKSNCAACHGADGRGHSPMGKALHVKDLASDDVQKQSDEALEKIIVDGKGKMAGFKGKLSESDIDALVKFIRSLAPLK